METEVTENTSPSEAAEAPLNSNPDTLSGGELRDAAGADFDPDMIPEGVEKEVTGSQAVKTMAIGSEDADDPHLQEKALEWFMDPTNIPPARRKVLKLNMGTETEPDWIAWEITAIPMEKVRGIRDRAAKAAERRKGNFDEYTVNLQMVIEGSVSPDVRAICRNLEQANPGNAFPPERYLRDKFNSKSGLITQISSEIMSLSGFDADDVTVAEAVEAAGNS